MAVSFETERRLSTRRSLTLEALDTKSRRLSIASLANARDENLIRREAPIAEGLTIGEAVTNLIIACVGAGVVVFPAVMRDTGYALGVPLLLVGAGCCIETGTLVSYACGYAERLANADVGSTQTYGALAEAVGGAAMGIALKVSVSTAFTGFLIAFIQLSVDSIGSFFPGEEEDKPFNVIRFCIAMPCFACLLMVKDLKQMARFQFVGVVAVFMECGGIIVGGLLNFARAPSCPDILCIKYKAGPAEGRFMEAVGGSISIFVFAYAVLGTLPGLRSQLAEPQAVPRTLTLGFGGTFILYFFVMVLGYVGFGQAVPANISKSITASNPFVGRTASLGILINVLASTPIFSCCIMNNFESLGSSAVFMPLTLENIVVRLLFVVALFVGNSYVHYLLEVIGLVSSVFCVTNNIFFPIAFYYALRRKLPNEPAQSPPYRWILHILIFLLGLIVLFYGVKSSWETLEEKMEKPGTSENASTTMPEFGNTSTTMPEFGYTLFQ
eukprot:TRINITY_DN1295_c0_g1_i1.p1 TRINITY_DN1295_c0_g1~~TRINITY_DN1295_c0_g1_i1.p1  ORF type:complete len:510 (+),score=57.99 TRINITY_DN1295_c0_g1_i1:38-1531(+)